MKDQRTQLKIKIKNLADEARTIRTEERKVRGMERWGLQHHRKTVVRTAARRSLIAYQIIRGRDWESPCSAHMLTRYMDWKEVERMVRKYGSAEAIASLPQVEGQLKLSPSGDDDGENTEDARSNAA